MDADQSLKSHSPEGLGYIAPAALSRDSGSSPRGPIVQFHSPHRLEWNRYQLTVNGLEPALASARFLHLTDLHLRPFWLTAYDQLLTHIATHPPAHILFTGDFVEDKRDYRPAVPTLKRFITALLAHAPITAILGNHDGSLLAPHLEMMGVRILDGRRDIVTLPSGRIELIGLPGVSRDDLDLGSLNDLPPKSPGTPRMVLAHFPDQIRKIQQLKADVYLAGHTHGGQICLPFGIPLIRHDTLPRRYCSGVHRIDDTWLVVNRGVGFSDLPVRIFCPAEVIEFNLTPTGVEESR